MNKNPLGQGQLPAGFYANSASKKKNENRPGASRYRKSKVFGGETSNSMGDAGGSQELANIKAKMVGMPRLAITDEDIRFGEITLNDKLTGANDAGTNVIEDLIDLYLSVKIRKNEEIDQYDDKKL